MTFCVVALLFGHFCWCRGFCQRTSSDFFLLLLYNSLVKSICNTNNFNLTTLLFELSNISQKSIDEISAHDIVYFLGTKTAKNYKKIAKNWETSIFEILRSSNGFMFLTHVSKYAYVLVIMSKS